jgi:iron complex outermembrane receptor protein
MTSGSKGGMNLSIFAPHLTPVRSMKKLTGRFFLLFSVVTLLTVLSAPLQAQEVNVTFKIMDNNQAPVPFASVTVLPRTDTLNAQLKTADSTGKVVFRLLKNNQYLIRISSVDYKPVEKGITTTSNQTSFSFNLEPLIKSLAVVEVRSQKPLMRQEDDKTIVDAESLAASSTNAYEIIEKTPGLFVDQDGNIYLSSTTPTTVYINGREMKMSASDVATILKNLPPNSIQQIEILRTPSAKYDASGSGGIVNVVLRKGVKIGLTGSVNTGMNQGRYGNQFIGFNLNNNLNNRRSYINMQYSRRNSFEQIITDRYFAPDSVLNQDAFTKYPGRSFYTGYGIGYEINKKWEIDYDGRISLNHSDNRTANENIIRKVSTQSIITSQQNNIFNDNNSFSLNQGLSSKYKMDSLGSEWTTDFSWHFFKPKTDQLYVTEYSIPVSYTTGGDGKINNRRNFFTLQSDLKKKLPGKLTLETGIKSTLQQYRSETEYFKESNGTRAKDNFRTNTYRYRENINAIYVQASKTFGEFILKSGLRMENTNMNGQQIVPGDTTFRVERFDFFPYIYLSRKVVTIAGYELRAYLVYRRTISRPGYEQLNPFPRYIDQFLTEKGNPSLRPQFTTNYEANISVDERPLLAFGYNDTKDIFSNVVYQSEDSTRSVAYRTFDNTGTRKEFYFRGLGAIPPGKRYFFVVGAQYNHNFYEGLYENQPLSYKRGTWIFFTYHSFKIDKRSQATMNGFMRMKGQLGFYELSSFGQLNFSINRQFIKQKLVVTMSVNDIFYTNKNNFSISQGTVNAAGQRLADTRRFGLNIRYNFGIRKKEERNGMFDITPPE